jgi:hypothetical protein
MTLTEDLVKQLIKEVGVNKNNIVNLFKIVENHKRSLDEIYQELKLLNTPCDVTYTGLPVPIL